MSHLQSKVTSYQLFLSSSDLHYLAKEYSLWLNDLEKAYRTILNDPSITESTQGFQKLSNVLLKYCDALIECRNYSQKPRMGEDQVPVCADWNYKAKMALKAVIGRFKSFFESTPDYANLVEKMAELKELVR